MTPPQITAQSLTLKSLNYTKAKVFFNNSNTCIYNLATKHLQSSEPSMFLFYVLATKSSLPMSKSAYRLLTKMLLSEQSVAGFNTLESLIKK